MIDRRTGEVWFESRRCYRNFTTKSELPLGPILRLHALSGYGWVCDYRTYAMFIKRVNRNRKKSK